MELSQKLTQMNEYNIKQDQLNKAFVSAERTKSAFQLQRETAERSLLSLKQEERDMTKQQGSGAHSLSPEQKDKLKKRIEDVLGEIKATEMEEQKCYETEMMLYQQQQQLKNVRENLGNESQLLPIEPGLMKAPQKPSPSQFSSQGSEKGTHEQHHPTEELRGTHEQHGTHQLPGLRQTHGLQEQSGSHEQGVQRQPELHGQSGTTQEHGKVQGQSGFQSGTSGISGASSGFGGPGTKQHLEQDDVRSGSRAQGHDIGSGVQGQRGTQEYTSGIHGTQGVQGQRGTQEHTFGTHGVQGHGTQGVQGHGTQGVQGHGTQGVQGHEAQGVMPERRLHEQFGTHQQHGHGHSAMSETNTWEQPLPDAKGTIVGQQDYDTRKAREDARNLRSAMKGAGVDRSVIAQIAGTRTMMQRQMIAREYALMEGKEKQNLIDDLKSDVTGNLGKLVMPLFMQPGEFDAYSLNKAMEGIGCDSDVLIEILCTRTNRQIEDIKAAWTHILKSKHTLEERIADETKKLIGTSPFRGLCLKLLAAKRPQNIKPDTNRVQAEAEELHHMLSKDSKDKDNKTKFIEIFTERSWSYIAEFVKKFQTISKDWTLEAAIRKEFGNSSDTAQALRTIADFSIKPYDFWAEKLHVAMKGYGTDDSKLIRIVVSRCEVDLMNVVHVFGQRHGNGQSLKKWIESDTSGEYRTLLMLLCGC